MEIIKRRCLMCGGKENKFFGCVIDGLKRRCKRCSRFPYCIIPFVKGYKITDGICIDCR